MVGAVHQTVLLQ